MHATTSSHPFVRAVPRGADARSAAPADADGAIRLRLLAGLRREAWWHDDTANVFVADGRVVYQGLFRREAERAAARRLALATDGVRAVRDDRVREREWQAMA